MRTKPRRINYLLLGNDAQKKLEIISNSTTWFNIGTIKLIALVKQKSRQVNSLKDCTLNILWFLLWQNPKQIFAVSDHNRYTKSRNVKTKLMTLFLVLLSIFDCRSF